MLDRPSISLIKVTGESRDAVVGVLQILPQCELKALNFSSSAPASHLKWDPLTPHLLVPPTELHVIRGC